MQHYGDFILPCVWHIVALMVSHSYECLGIELHKIMVITLSNGLTIITLWPIGIYALHDTMHYFLSVYYKHVAHGLVFYFSHMNYNYVTHVGANMIRTFHKQEFVQMILSYRAIKFYKGPLNVKIGMRKWEGKKNKLTTPPNVMHSGQQEA